MNDALIFEVSESGFDTYVVENSKKLPVLAMFMGMWSEHCILMADTIERLAREFAGQFVFAKLDIETHGASRDKFKIQNIPTLLLFQNGEVSFSQEGEMQESELRLLLKGVGVFRESDELRERAREKHLAGSTPEAIMLLTQAIKSDPANTRVAMDMVQIFIDINQLAQARDLFNKLPARDKESDMGKSLVGQLNINELVAKTDGVEKLTQRLTANADDHDARFDLSLCFMAQHDYNSAIDHLFTILHNEPGYKEGAAREMIVTVCNMLSANEPDLAQEYRRRLANLMAG